MTSVYQPLGAYLREYLRSMPSALLVLLPR